MSWFPKEHRSLTLTEETWHAEHRCVSCGTLTEAIYRRAAPPLYPLECADCSRQGRHPYAGTWGDAWGVRAGASLHAEAGRRLGYGACEPGEPKRPDQDDIREEDER